MFSDYKRLSLAAIAGNTRTNYQKLQYFFSEANWSAKELIAEAVAKGIPFKSIVTDAWYTSTDLIEFVASKSLSLTAEH